jgi:hypothetical protein
MTVITVDGKELSNDDTEMLCEIHQMFVLDFFQHVMKKATTTDQVNRNLKALKDTMVVVLRFNPDMEKKLGHLRVWQTIFDLTK